MSANEHQLSVSVGRQVQFVRERAGRSVEWIAQKCGVKPAIIASLEAGRAQPSIAVLDRVAQALDTTLVALLRGARKRADSDRVPPAQILDRIARFVISELPDSVGDKLDVVESTVVRHAMFVSGGNKSAAARLLGLERKALVRRWDRIQRDARKKQKRAA
jgi:transcriptional regulator with XRE-family HTH domain